MISRQKIVSFMPQPVEAQKPWVFHYVDENTVDYTRAEQNLSDDQLCELLSDCTMILASPVMPFLNRRILESAKKLELVQFVGVGYDKIDMEAAADLGIPVANNAGLNAVTVAEHAMMMILALQRKGFLMHEEVMTGRWPEFVLGDLWEFRGRTLGILGLGAIGTEVAKMSRGFGVRILYNKRNRLSAERERELGVEYRSFDDLLKESDVLSIHVPLSDETRFMIGEQEISLMKDGVIVVNTTRRDVVDERALSKALRSGKIYGVGIDVPKTGDDRAEELRGLFHGCNAILTSHTASVSRQIVGRFTERVGDFVRRAVNGEPPRYPVTR